MSVGFRITYTRFAELRDDVVQQMARGGLLVKLDATYPLDTPVRLELVLPDGAVLAGDAKVLQSLAGLGVAVSVGAELVEAARVAAVGDDSARMGSARHERIEGNAPKPAVAEGSRPSITRPPYDALSNADKVQLALRGSRDDRNAVLRDTNRTLHPYVLKNPQLNIDDVTAIAKSTTVGPELLKQIGERSDWLQKPAVALALARNHKTPPQTAIRALDYVPLDALRQMAKGGALPHITQAARKKIIR